MASRSVYLMSPAALRKEVLRLRQELATARAEEARLRERNGAYLGAMVRASLDKAVTTARLAACEHSLQVYESPTPTMRTGTHA